MSTKPLQHQVVEAIKRRVDAWRGFVLGNAADAYPDDAPRYEPVADGEQAVSETTMALLQHWFRKEPHVIGVEPHTFAFKYWPHQRRLVETFIYLHEVLGLRRTQQLYDLAGVEKMGDQRDPWAKLGGQLATGSGKTKMMSLLIAWSYLNSVCEPDNRLGLGRHAILIAPGLFVKDRLLLDFAPSDHGVPVFWSDPVIPPELERFWKLNVYDPNTCPRQLDPDEGALVVTNYHQLLRTSEDLEQPLDPMQDRQIQILFGDREPEKLEAVKAPLLDRFARSRGVLVLNDEAHHVWDEPGHAEFEEKARQKAEGAGDEDAVEAMAWIRSIRKLNGNENAPGRVGLQVDLSATLFQETGTTTQTKKKTKKGLPEVRFKENELFRHTVVTYDLAEAIRDGIVKKPILERVEVKNERTGQPLPLVQAAAPNAWKKYEHLLTTGIERWVKVRDQLRAEGDGRKPILFVLCSDKNEAAEVANFLTFGEATRDDLSGKPVTGYVEPKARERLFVEKGQDGVARSTVVQIHIGQKEDANEAEWEKVRAAVNAIDKGEIELRDEHGNVATIPNPYNVVISVMMLKEGWDVRNVKVIVPLRPCGSRTLTEQALGRGLRKMHPPEIRDDGSAAMTPEELYVIEHPSFQEILDQIDDLIERKSGKDIDHKPEYVAVPPVEEEAPSEEDVRLVRVGEPRVGARDWRKDVEVTKLPGLAPRIPWLAEIDKVQIRTWLKTALQVGEQEGQEFTLPTDPSYRDFDHVIEVAYALPLLRELKLAFTHKNAVKDVVREFLERKTFALPAGIPIRFDEAKDPESATIALGNLSRGDVGEAVRNALRKPIHDAVGASLRASKADIEERLGSRIPGYQALKQGLLEHLKKSPFQRLAGANPEERRLAILLEDSKDVVRWLFNHRHGVGYSIPYDWQGHTAHYFPDFIVRARFGEVFHNFIIEVKGRLDDKDKAKALRGRRWCEILTENDVEPWHFLMLIENAALEREDITWWQALSSHAIEDLLRHHESLPLFPDPAAGGGGLQHVLPDIGADEQFQTALPVYDLAVKAGSWGSEVEPAVVGWARVPRRPLEADMFVAKVVGRSMEPGIPDGAWGLFRSFPADGQPSPTTLDGRRVVVRLTSKSDPETGKYTLKRWRVTKVAGDQIQEVTLRPDNKVLKPLVVTANDGEVRVVAEYLETVG